MTVLHVKNYYQGKNDKQSIVSSIRSIITIGALSVHAIFEGLAIGGSHLKFDMKKSSHMIGFFLLRTATDSL